jgi:outer membrane receptor for ferrienterochelin and colicin
MFTRLKALAVAASIGFVVFPLAGCDLLSPSTPESALEKMTKLSGEGKTNEAITVGEKFLKQYSDPEGRVNAELGDLFLKKGDAASAAKYMQNAIRSGAISSGSVDIRIQTERSERIESAPQQDVRGSNSVSVDGAHVKSGPGGTEVRAGDAVVRTQK